MTYNRNRTKQPTLNMDTTGDIIPNDGQLNAMLQDQELDETITKCISNIDKSNKDLMRKRAAETDDIMAKLQKPQKKQKTVARKRKPQASNEMDIQNAEEDDEHDQKPLKCKKGVDTKTSPSKVSTLFAELKEHQAEKIEYFKNTAFGHFIDLKIGRLPSQLALNLLDSYDRIKQIIRLDEGRSIRVCERNVHNTLGLPMGKISMLVNPANTTTESGERMKEEFLEQFGEVGSRQTVKLHELKDLILNGEVGPNFVRNLIVYISTSIIFCRGNDNVVLDIIPHLQDINRIHELNWCEYVMSKLAETKEKFDKTSKKSYYGPLLFLIVSCRAPTLYLQSS